MYEYSLQVQVQSTSFMSVYRLSRSLFAPGVTQLTAMTWLCHVLGLRVMVPSHLDASNISREQFKSGLKTWLFVEAYSYRGGSECHILIALSSHRNRNCWNS